MMKRYQILLDTDIGDDIDDAFALALALSHPEIELIGVTTVFKHTTARAKMVHKFLSITNQETIPVRVGEANPLFEPIHFFERDQVNEFGDILPCQYDHSYDQYKISNESAVDFIIAQARARNNELILVPVGPLTNIAKAIQKAPDICSKIKKIVLMGGWFESPHPEWNILCDPEAADIVFRSSVPVYCVGLNVTLQCTLEDNYLHRLHENLDERSKLLSLWLKRWFQHFDFKKSVMHDPLAVLSAISEVCTFEHKRVKVDLEEKRGRILSFSLDDKQGSLVYTATHVDVNQFFACFSQYLL